MRLSRWRAVLTVSLKLCLLEVYTNRSRSFITSLGIFLGVAALLFNLAFVRGMDDDLRSGMEKVGGLNVITLQAAEPVTPDEKTLFQRSPGLSIAEAEQLVEEFSYVNSTIRRKDLNWKRFHAAGKRSHGKLTAVGTEYLEVYNYQVSHGRTLSEEDMTKRKHVCLIGSRLAERLFEGSGKALGKSLQVRGILLQVVGIIHSSTHRDRRAMECLFPFSTYATRFREATRGLSEVSLLLSSSVYVEQARNELSRRVQSLHRGVKDFEVEASLDKIREMQTASQGMKIILWSVAVISLVVGGISIMNIMFATIGDRIREIGVRKALGARRVDLFMQFLIEAVLVCFVGGIPGMIVGSSVTMMREGLLPYMPRLTVEDYAVAFSFTVIAGLLSGLFPAMRAARMQPVEALRY